jgi:hypothetical protein
MDTLSAAKNELITLLQDHQFEHLSQNEQARLRDYLHHISKTLEEAANLQRIRQTPRKRARYQKLMIS